MSDPITAPAAEKPSPDVVRHPRFLPRIGSRGYYLLLAAVAIFILGPLGGITAAFMNFSIGFFVGGQVLAGILGSAVTFGYGPEGKHGANYIQTMAASVAGMCGMAVLAQAMVWLGIPEPPAWELIVYYLCIGMFGVGVGMLYTPILVDRMELKFPSGFAVANILRALSDKELLKRSITKLASGMAAGYAIGVSSLNISWFTRFGLSASGVTVLEKAGISASTLGAGAIVGARIAIPALVVALIGVWTTPYLISIGWLHEGDPFRKIGFIISLGTILGAAIVDIILILIQAVRRFIEKSAEAAAPQEDWKRVNQVGLFVWILFWGIGIVVFGSQVLHQPWPFLAIAVLLSFLFVLVNGISLGISDWNPISSAFVLSVFLMATLGLRDPGVGLLAASIVFIACSEGGDMQQDRSTGWRLGTNRVMQFRYQVIGITMGAVLAVVLAKLFMSAYPILTQDQFANPHLPGAEKWQSAMTYKFVGALRGITSAQPQVMAALQLGIALGLVIEILRKLIKSRAQYKQWVAGSRSGKVTDFLLDAVFLSSPYASSFGGFVEIPTVLWWTAGGVISSLYNGLTANRTKGAVESEAEGLPSDMSTTSLVGGGLIAGDSLAALTVGIWGLLHTVF
ncbi:MAG TPA: OPT/YSL family transporter [Chthoniobacterales bacterium]|nr:OPT/YSL family transporter [Chthoniobacterales bacterium]